MRRKSPPPPQVEDNSDENVYLVIDEPQPARRPRTGKKKKNSQMEIDKLLQ